MLIIILILLVVILGYVFITKNHNYWKKRDVPYRKPDPLFGNFLKQYLRLSSLTDDLMTSYNLFPNERVTGMFFFLKPVIMIKDPELIKQITVKSFDHFTDHTPFAIRDDVDPVFAKNLFSLNGKKWKDMRSTLSPAFTSSKMKLMFDLISKCGEQMSDHFLERCREQNGAPLVIEMKEMFAHFTSDVIGTAAFGINVDSFRDPKHEFYKMGQNLTNLSAVRMMLIIIMPKIMKLFRIGLIPKSIVDYFQQVIELNLRTREEQNIIRPDIIHLLMEARKGIIAEDNSKDVEDTGFATAVEHNSEVLDKKAKLDLSNEDIVAQAMIFFFAGFDTASTLLSFTAYELAVNPDVQQRLQSEIDETLNQCNGKITYDQLFKMKYMDMIITETLRKWPPAPNIDRLCTKTFILETPERYISIKKGVAVVLPVYPIHHDPKYFPNPDKFDPERFSDENKDSIQPYTYFPFGIGPRSCIGSRFALMETKIAVFHLLSKFNFEASEKLDVPLKLAKIPFKFAAANGIWIALKPREVQ